MRRLQTFLLVSGLGMALFVSFGCQSRDTTGNQGENPSTDGGTQDAVVDASGETPGDGTGDETGDVSQKDDAPETAENSERVRRHWRTKELRGSIREGLAFLAEVQGPNGGWGQDGGQSGDARNPDKLESSGNDVANTSIAGLALLRSRLTPVQGTYQNEIRKAVKFVLDEVEDAPEEGLAVTDKKGTQIQRKLGRHVDTFLSGKFLTKASRTLEDGKLKDRVDRAVQKIVGKIERNQNEDGTWGNGRGWASAISTSFGDQSLAAAKESGYQVSGRVQKKVKQWARKKYDASSGSFKADEAADVELYQGGASAQALSRSEADRSENKKVLNSVEEKVENDRFVKGFGSGGGEEFVSYFNLTQTLKRTRSEKFGKWTEKITRYLEKTQNNDGSWAGRHCITGRVACTSAAVLTMTEKRTAAPELVSSK